MRALAFLFILMHALAGQAPAQVHVLRSKYMYRWHSDTAAAGYFETVGTLNADVEIDLGKANIKSESPAFPAPGHFSGTTVLKPARSYQLFFRKKEPGVLAEWWQLELGEQRQATALLKKTVYKELPKDTSVVGYYADIPDFNFTTSYRRDKRLDDSEYHYGKDLGYMYKAIRKSKAADEGNRFTVLPGQIVWEHFSNVSDKVPEFRKVLVVSAKDTHVLASDEHQQLVFKCTDEENPDRSYQIFFGRNPQIDPLKDTGMMVVSDEAADHQLLYVFYN